MLIMAKESGFGVIEGLVLMYVAWIKIKPFLTKQVDDLKIEMATQMTSVRSEIGEISKSVNRLSENLTALEKAQTKRFEQIEDRIEKLETKGN